MACWLIWATTPFSTHPVNGLISIITTINMKKIMASITKKAKVTIIVPAYNADKTINETLDSICNQKFNLHDIEVILTDDNSSDNTVDMMYEWYCCNVNRFFGIKLLSKNKNHGTVRNINSAVFLSQGEWIKIIAADDILYSNCLDVFWRSKDLYPQAKVLCGVCEIFITDDSYENRYHSEFYPTKENRCKFTASAAAQLQLLCNENFINAPSTFINGNYLRDANGFDERFTYLEDYPFWVKVCSDEYPIVLVEYNKPIVAYRMSEHSVSNSTRINDVSNKYIHDLDLFQDILSMTLPDMRKDSIAHSFININNLVYEVERRKFNKVVIYGASGDIKALVTAFIINNVKVILILDNDNKKRSLIIEGVNVVDVNGSFYEHDICFVINSISYKYDMIRSLRSRFGKHLSREQVITDCSSLAW
ncbi:glycosyltransferase [Aeromonas veronii]